MMISYSSSFGKWWCQLALFSIKALLLAIQLHHVLRVAGNLQTIAVYHSAEVIKVVVCGRFMEAVANADTIVFDKTGTLTYATPRVAMIETFGDREESEISLPT